MSLLLCLLCSFLSKEICSFVLLSKNCHEGTTFQACLQAINGKKGFLINLNLSSPSVGLRAS